MQLNARVGTPLRQMLNRSPSRFSESKFAAFNQVSRPNLIAQDRPELLGRQSQHGRLGRKLDQIIHPLLGQQLPLQIERREARGRMSGSQNGKWMRLKGDGGQARPACLAAKLPARFQQPLMAAMDAVEIPDREDRSWRKLCEAFEAVQKIHNSLYRRAISRYYNDRPILAKPTKEDPMKYALLALAAAMISSNSARGAIHTETVKYKAGTIEAVGYLAYDDSKAGKRPGIVVVPEWWGMTDYPKHRAQQLAELGYVALAADMYGNGMTTDDPNQAGQWSGALRNGDRKELRDRIVAALNQLKANPHVDANKTAAIGYCFGGTTVLELARMGADVRGVVNTPSSGTSCVPQSRLAVGTPIVRPR